MIAAQSKNMMVNKKVFILFFIIILLYGARFYQAYQVWYQPFNFNDLDQLYKQSQFGQKQNIIEDWQLYPYAGWIYITLGNLANVNVEHPPLGKYLYGIAELWLGDPVYIQIFASILAFFIVFLLSRQIYSIKWLSLTIPFMLIWERLFITHSVLALLDMLLSVPVFIFIYLVCIKKDININQLIILGILLGMAASIKFPASAIILGMAYLAHRIINHGLKFKENWLVAVVGVCFYILMYLPLFFQQGITGFINAQEKALRIHLSHVPNYPLMSPLRVMLFNQWPVWWDQIKPVWQVDDWNYLWPLLAIGIIY